MDERTLALLVAFAASDWARGASFDAFRDHLQDWDAALIRRGDKIVGTALFQQQNREVHFSILPEWRKRWLSKDLLANIKAWQNVRTKVPQGFEFMHDILERVGFVQIDAENWHKD